jgi:hypothetical protein
MSDSPYPSMRREIQDYLRSCERLLAAALQPNHPPFSKDELDMVAYYGDEIAKMHALWANK